MTHGLRDLQPRSINAFLPWVISIVCLLPWAFLQTNTAVKDNIAWLSICAGRLLNGRDMIQACYDTNPPLSILVYIPPIWISQITGIAHYYSIYFLTAVFVLLSCLAVYKILSTWKSINTKERIVFTTGFLAGVTILPALSYAERDHLVVLGLMPFVLAQLSITRGTKLSPCLLYPVLLLGTLAILIKPHFGLLPSLILLHRVIVRRRLFSIIKDMDFLFLSIFSVAYTSLIVFIYPEFLHTILPDVFDFYLSAQNGSIVGSLAFKYGIFILVCAGIAFLIQEKQTSPSAPELLFSTLFGTLICLLVYYIQMKGFFYHLIPMYAFLAASLSLLSYRLFGLTAQKIKMILPHNLLLLLFCAFVFLAAYFKSPPSPGYIGHRDYENAPLTTFIQQNCAQPCSFFMTYINMSIVSQTAFYSGGTYATRFPSYWFFPILNSRKLAATDQNEIQYLDHAHRRFASYAVNDLQTYKPSLLLIVRNPPEIPEKFALNYFEFISIDPDFQDVIENYEKIGIFKADSAYYSKRAFDGSGHLIIWDVYKRKTSSPINSMAVQ